MITFRKLGRFGNIGNSLFQYCTLLGVSKKTGFEARIPNNRTYYHDLYDNYNYSILDGFDIHTKFIGEEEYKHKFICEWGFDSKIFSISDGTNLFGYFQSEKYFNFCRDYILDNLQFKPNIIKQGAKLFADLDILPEETTSIHVRRGDYLKLQDIHPQQPVQYFKQGIELTPNKNYLIFSDDITWCKKTYGKNQNVYFSDNKNPFVDLYAMSKCIYNIIVNSSFSWWAAWLNNNKTKKVVAPRNWFGVKNRHKLDTTDLIPETWLII